ncbi:unnamed protein product [Amoebophrya sp. A25]|nr:unnamed protein product [Amoebophrya sp. A25]|eukprot:GSA25T00007905001.1
MASSTSKKPEAAGPLLSAVWQPVAELRSFYTGGRAVSWDDRVYCLAAEDLHVFDPAHLRVVAGREEETQPFQQVVNDVSSARDKDKAVIPSQSRVLIPENHDGIPSSTSVSVQELLSIKTSASGSSANGHGRRPCRVITSHRSNLLKCHDGETGKLIHTWRGHADLCTDLDCSPRGDFLASCGIDGCVKVFDLDGFFATHSFSGHSSTPVLVRWPEAQTQAARTSLLSADDEGEIRLWSLLTKTCLSVVKQHLAQVTDFAFFNHGSRFVSVGRDNVLNFWGFDKDNTGKITHQKTVPCYEAVEGVCCVRAQQMKPTKKASICAEPDQKEYLATVGEKGEIRVWNCETRTKVLTVASPHGAKGAMRAIFSTNSNTDEHKRRTTKTGFVTAGEDHNLIYWELSRALNKQENPLQLKQTARYMGNNEEVLCAQFLDCCSAEDSDDHEEEESRGALEVLCAVSDEVPKIVDAQSFRVVQALKGHSEVVVSTAVRKDVIATGSKDNTVRLWDRVSGQCLACLKGHTNSVLAICFPNKAEDVLFSSGADKTLKMWKLRENPTAGGTGSSGDASLPLLASAEVTRLAHDKDVNVLAFGPRGDKMLATGGQDKAIKLWSYPNLDLLGEMTGHRRGIWSLCFHPTDKVLLSGSGDATVRLWNLALKSFEGHGGAVLNVKFLGAFGMQAMSTGADGLVKLWQVRTTDCAQTLDSHEGKIWGMDVVDVNEKVLQLRTKEKNGENGDTSSKGTMRPVMITGGDRLVLWKDCTKEVSEKQCQEDAANRVQQAEIKALVAEEKYDRALAHCLKLNRPGQMVEVFNTLGLREAEAAVMHQEEQRYLQKLANKKAVEEAKASTSRSEESPSREEREDEKAASNEIFDELRAKAAAGEEDKQVENEDQKTNEDVVGMPPASSQDVDEEEEDDDDLVVDAVVVDPAVVFGKKAAAALQASSPGASQSDEEKDGATTATSAASLPASKFSLASWLRSLSTNEIEQLVDFLTRWNANGKTALLANVVLRELLRCRERAELARVENFNQVAKAIVAYADKHRARWEQLLSKTYLVDLLLQSSGFQLREDTEQGKRAEKAEKTTNRVLFEGTSAASSLGGVARGSSSSTTMQSSPAKLSGGAVYQSRTTPAAPSSAGGDNGEGAVTPETPAVASNKRPAPNTEKEMKMPNLNGQSGENKKKLKSQPMKSMKKAKR